MKSSLRSDVPGQAGVKRLDAIKGLMAERISAAHRDCFRSRKRARNSGVVRVEFRAPALKPLEWLAAQPDEIKTFWSDRDEAFEMAGIGAADVVFSDSAIDYGGLFASFQRRLRGGGRRARYYGGLRFDAANVTGRSDKAWRRFGICRFLIPRFELHAEYAGTRFACNIMPDRDGDALSEILGQLERVNFDAGYRLPAIPDVISRRDIPGEEAWRKIVGAVGRALDRKEFEKIVLARKTVWKFRDRPDPIGVSMRLNKVAGACFHFCFQLAGDVSFVGVTPELLYRRERNRIETEAIAGTRPRLEAPEADHALRQELLNSKKERREHEYVVENIEESLGRLCASFRRKGRTSVLKLAGIQHLIRRFDGVLKRGVSDARILELLHPTSAVGGSPTPAAVEKIRELEPFDRGWYAGPVGWVGENSACMAVAIRSCLTEGRKLHAYSAAGIIDGSTPAGEWDETENKIESFAGSLSL